MNRKYWWIVLISFVPAIIIWLNVPPIKQLENEVFGEYSSNLWNNDETLTLLENNTWVLTRSHPAASRAEGEWHKYSTSDGRLYFTFSHFPKISRDVSIELSKLPVGNWDGEFIFSRIFGTTLNRNINSNYIFIKK